ncbi:MAG: hypothetical protein DYH06_22000 [Acidobacteria bacterium ACB2]|nr:hypothetical protein [Acidobacteria bacterium ACB2]
MALLALAATAASAALSWGVFGAVPHVADEVSYLWQARILASARLWLEPPPVPDAFRAQNVVLTATRWCSLYPPGWPLLLALGSAAGAPWLLAPLLTGLAVLGAARLGRLLYGERESLLGALLLSASPFTLLTGAGFMAHPAGLALGLWCLALLVEAERTGRPGRMAAAGLLAGLCAIVRPYTAATLLLPAFAWIGARSLRAGSPARRFLPAVAAGLVPLGALLAFQAASFGSPFRSGYRVYDPTIGLFSFLGKRYEPWALLREHLPAYLSDLSGALWDVPGPPFWFLLALLLAPAAGDGLLLVSAAGLVLGQSLFWNYDVSHGGPRYAFEAAGALSLLSARAFLLLLDRAGRLTARFGLFAAPASRRLGAGAAIAAVLLPPLLVRLPLLARSHALSYHAVLNEPLAGASAAGVPERAVVFVATTTEVAGYPPQASPTYHSYLNLNALPPGAGGRVFVRDLPGLREEVLRAFPGREAWRVHVLLRPAVEGESVVGHTWKLQGLTWSRLAAPPP